MEAKLTITKVDYEEMLAHLLDLYPLEGCGLLAGNNGRVAGRYPIDNVLASAYRFEMDPQQQLRALQHLEAAGWDLLAIYHSHPQGPERPSETDVAHAYYPDAIQLIVSLKDRAQPSVRAFTIVQGQVDEVGLKIR